MKKLTKEEAISYCMDRINSKDLEFDEFNNLRQYKARHKKGELKENAIQRLFDRFGVSENCYYTIKKD